MEGWPAAGAGWSAGAEGFFLRKGKLSIWQADCNVFSIKQRKACG